MSWFSRDFPASFSGDSWKSHVPVDRWYKPWKSLEVPCWGRAVGRRNVLWRFMLCKPLVHVGTSICSPHKYSSVLKEGRVIRAIYEVVRPRYNRIIHHRSRPPGSYPIGDASVYARAVVTRKVARVEGRTCRPLVESRVVSDRQWGQGNLRNGDARTCVQEWFPRTMV